MTKLLCQIFQNATTLNAVYSTGIIPSLCILTTDPNPEIISNSLSCLGILMQNSDLIKEGLKSGLQLYLLNLFTNAKTDPEIRGKSGEIFAKILSDKSQGPIFAIFLKKLLPSMLVDLLVENQNPLKIYDANSEKNPELFWNEEFRNKLSNYVSMELNQLVKAQRNDLNSVWMNFENVQNLYKNEELEISGVYLRIYNENPGWVLRKPREFFKDLLEFGFANMENEQVAKSFGILLTNNVNLIDLLVSMGYVGKILSNLNYIVPLELFQFLHCSQVVMENLAQFESIICVVKVLKHEKNIPKLIHGVGKILKNSDLIGQALKSGLIELLLSYLKNKDSLLGDKIAVTKAEIVQTLQNCQDDVVFGAEVEKILEKSQVWKNFKGQKHDLFLENRNDGFLTNSSLSYLTDGKNRNVEKPPE
jgi:DnaJ family protein C protein 13